MTNQPREEDTLRHVMTSPVRTMESNGTVAAAANIMVQHDFGSIVVVEGKKPVGIITERDITKQVIKGEKVLKETVKNVMTKAIVTAPPSMPIQDAFELMLTNKVRRLPIVENNNIVGIVTVKDLMRWVLRVSYEPNIPKRIKMILEAQ
ncbi:MAG: CBS domain-containing protein [Candidatus Bathyarchaeia archaeon]